MQETTLIILKKIPYRDQDLILNGLSPDFGRMNLVAYGAQRVAEKKFPVLDLFREVRISFAEKPGNTPDEREMIQLKDAELETAFDPLADVLELYRFAGKIGDFLLKNSITNVPMAMTYDALRNVLQALTLHATKSATPETWSPAACGVVIKLVFLQENGELPDFGDSPAQQLFDSIIESGIEGSPLVECPKEYWGKLSIYLNKLLISNHFTVA